MHEFRVAFSNPFLDLDAHSSNFGLVKGVKIIQSVPADDCNHGLEGLVLTIGLKKEQGTNMRHTLNVADI